MKNLSKSIIALCAFALLFTSCASFLGVNMDKVSMGMDKQTVFAKLKLKSNQKIGVRKYPNGVVEVLAYNDPAEKWLYFYNDKLVEISIPTRDWQREADLIVADNDTPLQRAPVTGETTTKGEK